MRPWFCSIVLAFALAARAELPTAPVYVGFAGYSGSTFLKLTKADREMYCLGMLDGILASPLLGADQETIKRFVDRMKDRKITPEQLDAIVSKYIRDHPENWDQSSNILATAAFKEAFIPAAKPKKD